MKNTYYFSHDYNTRLDVKIQKLLKEFGAEGYGVYWMIVETLYSNDNSLELDYNSLSYDLRVDESIIKAIINDFKLFKIDNDTFYSESIETRLNLRNLRSEKARENANKRWNNANALQKKCKSITIKENKEKEKKVNKIDDDVLCNISDLQKRYLENETLITAFCKGQNTNKEILISKLKEFNVFLSETDLKMKTWNDYTTHFRNWFKKNREYTIKSKKINLGI